MPRQVTINMVAERAGVSRGTVDRVLNGRPHVKPEIYARGVQGIALCAQDHRAVVDKLWALHAQGIPGITFHGVSGCVEAIRTVRPNGGIHVSSHDLTDDTKRLLKSGEIDFAIVQDIYRQGYQPLVLLRDYIQRQILPQPDNGRSTIEIICTENLNADA